MRRNAEARCPDPCAGTHPHAVAEVLDDPHERRTVLGHERGEFGEADGALPIVVYGPEKLREILFGVFVLVRIVVSARAGRNA